MLHDDFFTSWRGDPSPKHEDSPEQMQKKDPLGIQIWKLYSKQKNALPNGQRMDNLSWRMMSMNLKRQKEEHARYVDSLCQSLPLPTVPINLSFLPANLS